MQYHIEKDSRIQDLYACCLIVCDGENFIAEWESKQAEWVT